MSTINAVRIINLNYNNNAIRIVDEIFQLGGESTLLSLRNGGGKSVLVQMMTAPFVHKQYRKTKDRPFESYFTSAKPTFILVEWKLDGDAGYCLTGMMVRRSQMAEEQGQEPLEIINFISEYSCRCEHDLYHIPLAERSKNEVILKNFTTCRQIFEGYKKDSTKKFFYYDMNHYAQSKQYFDKLREYKIYDKEWETIIRKVNIKESGLSELFSDCKNEKELIEKWFLEAIENKLNKEQNRMKEFQTIMEKYIRMYKDNRSKIERRDTILQFKEDMRSVEERAGNYQIGEMELEQAKNRIACFRQELSLMEKKTGRNLEELIQQGQEWEEQIAQIEYEKKSLEIHQLMEQLRFHSSNRDMIGLEKDALEEEIAKIEKILHRYACVKQKNVAEEWMVEHESLRQRLEFFKEKNEKERIPRRQQIGGWLNYYYQRETEKSRLLEEKKKEEGKEKEKQLKAQREQEMDCQKKIEEQIKVMGRMEAGIEVFEQQEQSFNQSFGEQFSRNIMGEYEPGIMEIKKLEYEKQMTEAIRTLKQGKSSLLKEQENLRSKERQKEDTRKEIQDLKLQEQILERQEEEYHQQLNERRMIMRYLGAEDTLLWEKDKLLGKVDHKLMELEQNRGKLEQEIRERKREWKKLTSGEVLELPQDFQEMLIRMELHPVHGMNWLEKNGYSAEENRKLIHHQPFLPYSLILPEAEITKLKNHHQEIFTSFPIPLIPREALEQTLTEERSTVLKLSGISFYLWFNEKLLDEEALHAMITELGEKIQKKEAQLEQRREEYFVYSEKKMMLKNQTIHSQTGEVLQNHREEIQEQWEAAQKKLHTFSEETFALQQKIEDLRNWISEEEKRITGYQRREEEFGQFCVSYEEYLKNRRIWAESEGEKKRYEEKKKLALECQEKYQEELETLKNQLQQLMIRTGQYKDKQLTFNVYEAKEFQQADDSLPLLEAEYKALDSEICGELKQLEDALEKAARNREREERELRNRKNKYGVTEEELENFHYDEKEELHQEILCEDRRDKLKRKVLLWNEEDKEVYRLDEKIKDKKNILLEQCGHETPLPKERIYCTDFDKERNKLKFLLKESLGEKKKVEIRLQSIRSNQDVLAEYQDFQITDSVEWEECLEEMEEKELQKLSGTIRQQYRNSNEQRRRLKEKLEEELYRLLRKEIYRENYYQKPLESMLSVTGQAKMMLAQLDTTLRAYDSQIEKLAVDIELVEREKQKIEDLLEEYIREVHRNMAKIDGNSTITIRNKEIKMLRLQLPDWEENEVLYHQRLDDYLEELTRNGVKIYEANENAINYLSSRMTTKCLYDGVVGIGNIQIKLYKIEEQREYPITWAEVARNSGGEGFLSAFIILSSLLQYMRRDETDIFADRKEGKVLVMDNPFAQTNAAHLLKPLMDMAKKTNTQLICLSGLGGDSIYSRFDNIYVLNLVSTSLRNGISYLRGEHTRGGEEEIMISSRFEVMEQQSLLF